MILIGSCNIEDFIAVLVLVEIRAGIEKSGAF
jgi:hypothetical protein